MSLKPDTKKILSEIGTTQYGRALRDYLDDAILVIGDIRQAKTWEETQGRRIAIETLGKLFSFIKEHKLDKKSKTEYT